MWCLWCQLMILKICAVLFFTSSFIVHMPLNTQKSHGTFSLSKEECELLLFLQKKHHGQISSLKKKGGTYDLIWFIAWRISLARLLHILYERESWRQESRDWKKVVDRSNKPGLNTVSRDENGLMSLAPDTGMFTRLKKLDQCLWRVWGNCITKETRSWA